MKVAVWSPVPFGGRKSSGLLSLVFQALQEESGEQLIIHADAFGSGPEHYLLGGRQRSRMIKKKEFGLELLCRLMQCGPCTKEMVVNASYSFADNRIHVLPAGDKMFYEETDRASKEICEMIRRTGSFFQNVWIELPAGKNEMVKAVFDIVDYIIGCFPQSPYVISSLEKCAEYPNMFYVVGAYETRNIYTIHNLQLLYPFLRGRCFGIPYDVAFMAACSVGEAEQYLRREASVERERKIPLIHSEIKKIYRKGIKGEKANDAEGGRMETTRETSGI